MQNIYEDPCYRKNQNQFLANILRLKKAHIWSKVQIKKKLVMDFNMHKYTHPLMIGAFKNKQNYR